MGKVWSAFSRSNHKLKDTPYLALTGEYGVSFVKSSSHMCCTYVTVISYVMSYHVRCYGELSLPRVAILWLVPHIHRLPMAKDIAQLVLLNHYTLLQWKPWASGHWMIISCKILCNHKIWFGVNMAVSLRNLTGTLAALLPRCLPNFRAIGSL